MGYEHDICLEQRFAPMIKSILGRQFIGQDPVADRRQATDFLTFTLNSVRVAARLRRFQYLARYGDEFTLRWSRPSGVPTEIDKVRDGWVRYLFYGFVDTEERRIVRYFIGDFLVFRQHEPEPIGVFVNTPPDSELAVYRLCDMPDGFLLKDYALKANVA